MEKMYKIVRIYKEDKDLDRTIKKNLTLKEAKTHCQDPSTEKKGVWMDVFVDMDI